MKTAQRNTLAALFLALFISILPASANATVMIDPATGLNSYFAWFGGLGPIGYIDTDFNTDWSITIPTDSVMPFITAYDSFMPGDQFGLVFDGKPTPWTTTYIDTDSYFHGIYNDLYLSAGTHYITLEVTALAPGTLEGGAFAEFSPVVAAEPTAIPEAGTFLMLAAGLAGLEVWRRKRARNL